MYLFIYGRHALVKGITCIYLLDGNCIAHIICILESKMVSLNYSLYVMYLYDVFICDVHVFIYIW